MIVEIFSYLAFLVGFSLFWLLVMHAILDFPLQGDTVAVNKNPNAKTKLQEKVPWYYWMGSHALSHGGGVALVTGSIVLGICEVIAHFIIDYFKCQEKFSIHGDQILHLTCKIVWAIVFALSA